jgi:monoamine oxidase
VKRRQAIRRLGVGFSSAIIGASWLTSCKKDDPGPAVNYDGEIVVIGAGPAGLYTADILLSLGLKVTVLEATKQIGGRVASLRNQQDLPYQSVADFPVELGAEYWQGNDSILGKITDNLHLQTIELTPDSRQYIINGLAKSAADWKGNPDFEFANGFLNNLKTYSGPATSVQAAATGASEQAMKIINSGAANFYGSSADRLGIKGLSEGLKLVSHDDKYYVLKNNAMQDLMISRFNSVSDKVKLESPVKSIDYTADPIKISLEDGSVVNANKVILTVPITILKNGIRFTPALPSDKTNALANIGMDPSMRVVLDFKKNFWGQGCSLIWGGTTAPQYFSSGMGRSQFNQTMTITINGPKALELSNLGDDDAIVKTILAELDILYNKQATQFIRTGLPPDDDQKMIYFIKDWTKEKYIQGGFSYPLVGTTLDTRKTLSLPIGDNVFFAGEATDINGEAGSLNGALASAERVVEDVVASIKKVS